MGLKDKLKSLGKTSRDYLSWFVLEDGTPYYFDPMEVWKIGFTHTVDCLHAQAEGVPFPPAQEIFRKIAQAKDRRRALEAIGGKGIFHYAAVRARPLA